MYEEEFQNYLDERINNRYEQAKFYLDILIENNIINTTDERIKSLFIRWFLENREFDLNKGWRFRY